MAQRHVWVRSTKLHRHEDQLVLAYLKHAYRCIKVSRVLISFQIERAVWMTILACSKPVACMILCLRRTAVPGNFKEWFEVQVVGVRFCAECELRKRAAQVELRGGESSIRNQTIDNK